MRRKFLRTYCMLVTLVSFYFYLTKFEPNQDMKLKAFTTFFLIQNSNIIYSFLFFYDTCICTSKKNNFNVFNGYERCEHQKSHMFFIKIYFGTVFLRQCMCVKDTCWGFSICYKFTIKESLKLTKGIKWWHINIVLKSDNIRFANTVKNNVQLGDEINGTKGTKHL